MKDRLNDVQALVQHGCKAFAEDTREVYDESNQWTSGGKHAGLDYFQRKYRKDLKAGKAKPFRLDNGKEEAV